MHAIFKALQLIQIFVTDSCAPWVTIAHLIAVHLIRANPQANVKFKALKFLNGSVLVVLS